jgi:hypothetical protein
VKKDRIALSGKGAQKFFYPKSYLPYGLYVYYRITFSVDTFPLRKKLPGWATLPEDPEN